MITAYEVGAIFRIQDDATPTLQRISREFKELQGLVDATNKSLAEFGKGIPFKRMTEGLSAVNKEITGIAENAAKIGTAFDASFDSSIGAATASVRGLNEQLVAARDIAASIRVPPIAAPGGGLPGAAGGGRGGVGGGSGGGAGGGSSGPHPRGSSLGSIGTSLPTPHGLHARSHNSMIVGAAIAGFGIWDSFEKYSDLAAIEENLRIGNISGSDIQKAETLSYATAQKYGLPVQSVMQGISEIRSPLGGIEPAMEHIDTLARASVILGNQDKARGTKSADDLYDMVKSAEFRNAIAPKDFDRAIHGMVAADVGSGGKVTPSQFLQMSKYMRSALPGLSDDFLYHYAPELAQEYNGSGAGTGMSSLYQQMEVAMRTTGINLLDSIGEIDRSKVKFDKDGRIKSMSPGANLLGDMFKRNPADAMAQVVRDLRSHGITDEGDQRNWFSSIYGNKVSANMAMTLAYQRLRLDRGSNTYSNVWGDSDAADELFNNNPRTKQNTVKSSFNNMLTSFGGATAGPMEKVFGALTNVFNAARGLQQSDLSVHVQGSPGAVWEHAKAYFGFSDDVKLPMRYANAPQGSWYDDMQANQSLHRAGYRNGELGREMGRESARGGASPGAVVQPQIEVKVNLKAYIDGKEIAVAVEQDVMPMILKEVAGALHMANLNNQGGGGGSLDAAHITGAGHH